MPFTQAACSLRRKSPVFGLHGVGPPTHKLIIHKGLLSSPDQLFRVCSGEPAIVYVTGDRHVRERIFQAGCSQRGVHTYEGEREAASLKHTVGSKPWLATRLAKLEETEAIGVVRTECVKQGSG